MNDDLRLMTREIDEATASVERTIATTDSVIAKLDRVGRIASVVFVVSLVLIALMIFYAGWLAA